MVRQAEEGRRGEPRDRRVDGSRKEGVGRSAEEDLLRHRVERGKREQHGCSSSGCKRLHGGGSAGRRQHPNRRREKQRPERRAAAEGAGLRHHDVLRSGSGDPASSGQEQREQHDSAGCPQKQIAGGSGRMTRYHEQDGKQAVHRNGKEEPERDEGGNRPDAGVAQAG